VRFFKKKLKKSAEAGGHVSAAGLYAVATAVVTLLFGTAVAFNKIK
jgi:hypothetical protein